MAMLAVLALSAVAASAAQAEEAPFFKVAGARLAEGQSVGVKAKTGTIDITAGSLGLGIYCSMGIASGAKLLGSKIGEPGKAEMTLEVSKCEIVGDGNGCKVTVRSGPPIGAKLVELFPRKHQFGVLLSSGSGETFFTLEHTPGTCNNGGKESFTGSLAAEILSKGEPVELGKEPAEAKTLELRFPATPIKKVWAIRAGEGTEVKPALYSELEYEVGSGGATLELAGSSLWGVFD